MNERFNDTSNDPVERILADGRGMINAEPVPATDVEEFLVKVGLVRHIVTRSDRPCTISDRLNAPIANSWATVHRVHPASSRWRTGQRVTMMSSTWSSTRSSRTHMPTPCRRRCPR